jgi:hypothetical protein
MKNKQFLFIIKKTYVQKQFSLIKKKRIMYNKKNLNFYY